jgi:uncharacterized protein (TIGR02246 family)
MAGQHISFGTKRGLSKCGRTDGQLIKLQDSTAKKRVTSLLGILKMKSNARSELIALYQMLIDHWNNQDAKGMGSLYTSSGGQVGFDGSQITGPKNIVRHLSPIFRDHPTHKYVFKILIVKDFGKKVGLIQAIAGMVPRNGLTIDSSKNTVQTMLAQQVRGRWKVVLFQNTPARLDGRPKAVGAMTKQLQGLVKRQLGTSKNRNSKYHSLD